MFHPFHLFCWGVFPLPPSLHSFPMSVSHPSAPEDGSGHPIEIVLTILRSRFRLKMEVHSPVCVPKSLPPIDLLSKSPISSSASFYSPCRFTTKRKYNTPLKMSGHHYNAQAWNNSINNPQFTGQYLQALLFGSVHSEPFPFRRPPIFSTAG